MSHQGPLSAVPPGFSASETFSRLIVCTHERLGTSRYRQSVSCAHTGSAEFCRGTLIRSVPVQNSGARLTLDGRGLRPSSWVLRARSRRVWRARHANGGWRGPPADLDLAAISIVASSGFIACIRDTFEITSRFTGPGGFRSHARCVCVTYFELRPPGMTV